MYIGTLPGQIKQHRFVWLGNLILLGAVALFSFTVVVSWNGRSTLRETSPALRERLPFEIGGPLGLNGVRSKGPLPALTKQLRLLGCSTRPDMATGTALLLLKGSQQERVVCSGEKIYLEQEGELFRFSFVKTPLFIQPTVMHEGISVAVQQGERKGFFTLKRGVAAPKVFAGQPYFEALKGGKCWGHDLFIEQYGGDELRGLTQKVKVEVGAEVLFVKEGDFLHWYDGRWHPLLLDHAPFCEPIAQVVRLLPGGVEVEVWEESGFQAAAVHIPVANAAPLACKMEEVFSGIRPRTASEVSCLLGKRRVVLREGDWWLKTEQGWKNLRRSSDIEDYLTYRLRGELFVLESVASERGETVLKAQLFDAMRTQMQPLAMTVQSDKKQKLAARHEKKKKSALVALGGAQ